jgi:putative transposase
MNTVGELIQQVGRRQPARGVHIHSTQPTIVFLTVCTRERKAWLNQDAVHETLQKVWRDANAWLVGYYLLMPDHIHLFCAPRDLHFTLESWLKFWQSQFSKAHKNPGQRFQTAAFHHRLRRQENYSEKWDYVRMNPVRKQLVANPEAWEFSGMLNVLRW